MSIAELTRTGFEPGTIDEETRSVEAIVATDQPVKVWDNQRRDVVDEVLLMDGAEFARQVPFLDAHQRDSVRRVLGSVRDIRIEGGRLVGRLYLVDTGDGVRAWRAIRDGHLTDVSAGYKRTSGEYIRAGETRTIGGRAFTAGSRTLRVTTAWTMVEVSAVPIGADPGTKIRSQETLTLRKDSLMITPYSGPAIHSREPELDTRSLTAGLAARMDLNVPPSLDQAAERYRHLSLPDVARACLRIEGREVPENWEDQVRNALSGGSLNDVLGGVVGASIRQGYAESPDTSVGWCAETAAPNYRTLQRFAVETASNLRPLPRGKEAEHVTASTSSETYKVGRFARQFIASEQMLLSDDLDSIGRILKDLGKGCRRLRPDLVYSLLLANPTLEADSKAVFHADHNNLATAALDAAALAAGMSAIASQRLTGDDGEPIPIGSGPMFLVVPPALTRTARGLARDIQLGDGQDLTVFTEPRLDGTGVHNPSTRQPQTGSDTNWLMASAGGPGVEAAYLEGRQEPDLTRFQLGPGQWGVGWKIKMDVGIGIVDFRGLYFSDGTT